MRFLLVVAWLMASCALSQSQSLQMLITRWNTWRFGHPPCLARSFEKQTCTVYTFLVSDESSWGYTQWTMVAMYLFHTYIDGYFIQCDSAQLKLTTVTTTKMCLATIDNVCPGFSTKLYAVDSRNRTMNRFVLRQLRPGCF